MSMSKAMAYTTPSRLNGAGKPGLTGIGRTSRVVTDAMTDLRFGTSSPYPVCQLTQEAVEGLGAGAFILDVQHSQLLGVLPSLGAAVQPDRQVRGIGAHLVGTDEREDVVVVVGDHPPLSVLELDRAEVPKRRPGVDWPPLPQQFGRLGSEVRLRLHEDNTGAVLEQYPRLVRAVDGGPPRLDEFYAFHPRLRLSLVSGRPDLTGVERTSRVVTDAMTPLPSTPPKSAEAGSWPLPHLRELPGHDPGVGSPAEPERC